MELDLGTKLKCKVMVNGGTFNITAPTVKQSEKYQKHIVKNPGTEMEAFVNLLDDLGMPKDVSEDLDVVQLQKLSEGLLGLVEKK